MSKLFVTPKWFISILACVLLLVLLPGASVARTPDGDAKMMPEYRPTIELPLLADTWVNGDDPTINCDCDICLVACTTGLDNILLTFDRSSLPRGARILRAELTINVTSESGACGKEMAVLNVEDFDSATVVYDDNLSTFNPSESLPVVLGTITFNVKTQLWGWDLVAEPVVPVGGPEHLIIPPETGQLAISAAGPCGRIVADSLETRKGQPPTLVVTYLP